MKNSIVNSISSRGNQIASNQQRSYESDFSYDEDDDSDSVHAGQFRTVNNTDVDPVIKLIDTVLDDKSQGSSLDHNNAPVEKIATSDEDPSSSIVIFSPDTDVLVIAVTHANMLSTKCFVELTRSRRVDVHIGCDTKVNIPTFGKHGKIGTHKLKDKTIELKEHRGLFARCAIVGTFDISKLTTKRLLSHIETKKQIVTFLAYEASRMLQAEKRLFTISFNGSNIGTIRFTEYNHEEAGTVMILHAVDISRDPSSPIVFFSPNTDVLVISVTHANMLSTKCFVELTRSRRVEVQKIYQILGKDRSKALAGFHAFIGCDTVGKFAGKSKTTWWKQFQKCSPSIVSAFCNLGEFETLDDYIVDSLSIFVANCYCPGSQSLEEARWKSFCRHPDQCEKIPPTKGSLIQHLLRAHHQTFIWRNAVNHEPCVLDPLMSGWTKEVDCYQPLTFNGDIAPNRNRLHNSPD
ncbi:hypothetical protein LOTGIDRAFT_161029 [Lottia gigantea]|uniref:Uncharacterized protein n=1 Tax=Lottia gigantea TaxID=225164 RepID=V3ZTI8_LOTGI|nr:hypothetical protein LOTGIDRAFT_161029 [Lottia gigantea]ESO94778.1 hypothetical protein LOTGIDRAFT_161029 [Lottia gigantea]